MSTHHSCSAHQPKKPARAAEDRAAYVPNFGQPEEDDTNLRRAEVFEHWTSPHGPCRVYGCDGEAVDDSGLCKEHNG
jgi:hypothetical protein